MIGYQARICYDSPMIRKLGFAKCGILVTLAVYLGFVACAPVQEFAEMPVPDAEMAAHTGESLDKLGKGYALSQVHCAQCHEFKLPKDMRVEEWHTIVPGMAWNAGLNSADESAVMAYLVAATRDLEQSEQ